MGKRVNRVKYHLDAKGIKQLPHHELKAILRAADPLIMSGGGTLLAKVLKRSKEKKLRELNLNSNPSYSYFNNLSIDEITAKIDWTVLKGFLAIKYDYRLPLLVYSPTGWEIEKETYSDELLFKFDQLLESGVKDYNMIYLKDRNRQIINLLLDKIRNLKILSIFQF